MYKIAGTFDKDINKGGINFNFGVSDKRADEIVRTIKTATVLESIKDKPDMCVDAILKDLVSKNIEFEHIGEISFFYYCLGKITEHFLYRPPLQSEILEAQLNSN